MKKILLLSALVAGVMSANAQTDFKVSKMSTLPVSEISNYDATVCRSAYGFNDKLYLVDRGAKQLRVFNLLTKEEVGQVEIGENNAMGHDEAGNAIIGNWGWAGSNLVGKKTTFTLISADLTKKVTTNETEYVIGRSDLLGKAKGNVFGAEGAILLAAGQNENFAENGFVQFTFTGGDEPTVEYSNVYEPTEEEEKQSIVGNTSLVFNYYKDIDGTDHYLYVNRSEPIVDFTVDEGQVSSKILYKPEDRVTAKGVNNGAEIFILGNRKFMAYPHLTLKDGVTYRDGFSIVEINADGTLTQVYRQESEHEPITPGWKSAQINWLCVDVLNENQAKLYQYFASHDGFAAEYGIAINGADTPTTGINNVNNAADVVSTTYYTADGVANKAAVKGLNIVVTKYADGSQKVVKLMK